MTTSADAPHPFARRRLAARGQCSYSPPTSRFVGLLLSGAQVSGNFGAIVMIVCPASTCFCCPCCAARSAFPSKLRFRTSNNEPGCPGIGVRAFAARRRRVADKEHKVNMQEAAAKFFTTETQRTRRRRNALAQRTQRRREGREGFSEGRCSAPSMSSWLIGFCGSAAISSAAGYAPSRSASSAKPSTTISQAGLGLGSGGPAAPHSSGRRTKAVR
jgi:hypothetical protein